MSHQVVLLLTLLTGASALQVGFFSQTYLNNTKASDPAVINYLARVFERYDICGFNLLTELDAMDVLLANLQKRNQNFKVLVSDLLSRPAFPVTPYLKESFGFLYKSHVVSLSPLIRDELTSIVSTKVKILTNNEDFVYSIVHLIPFDEVNQLAMIPGAYERISADFETKNVLFGGDFNTMKVFLSEEDYKHATVSIDPCFQWYIDYEGKTIDLPDISGAGHRFLGAGAVKDWVMPGSDRILNVTHYYGIKTLEQLWSTSVFNPIELELYEKGIYPGPGKSSENPADTQASESPESG